MELSVYVDDVTEAAPARASLGLIPPAGGWALVPAVDDLVALAASLNTLDNVVFIDHTV